MDTPPEKTCSSHRPTDGAGGPRRGTGQLVRGRVETRTPFSSRPGPVWLSLLTDQTRDSSAFRAEVARSPLGGQGREGEGGRLLRPHR